MLDLASNKNPGENTVGEYIRSIGQKLFFGFHSQILQNLGETD